MQGKRTSTDKKVAVIKAKLEDPNKSLRDIEKETGVHFKTSWDIINRIPEVTKSDSGQLMIENIDEILSDIMNLTKKNVKRYDKELLKTKELRDLSAIAKENFERKRILQWEPTDISRMDFNLEGKSIRELEEMRKQLLSSKK